MPGPGSGLVLGARAGQPMDRAVMAEDVRAIYDMRAFTGIRTGESPSPTGKLRSFILSVSCPMLATSK